MVLYRTGNYHFRQLGHDHLINLISLVFFWNSSADTQHQFNARESDWGFTSFMPLQELYDPMRGFLVNDTLVLEADVNVRKVVDYWAYDSKKETGFVGLKNQGATCYMNSLLQTLYHLAYFRKVLSLPASLFPAPSPH
jgi:ubiquitin carboxyl-terminal hydrolase 7